MLLGAIGDDFTGSSDLGLIFAKGGTGRRHAQTADLLPDMRAAGYDGAFGCEDRARAGPGAGLGWIKAFSGL